MSFGERDFIVRSAQILGFFVAALAKRDYFRAADR
jgi:hypothetical protein